MSAAFKRSLLERRERPRASNGRAARLHRLFSEDIWRLDAEPVGWFMGAVRRVARLGFLTLSGFGSDRCLVRASALTYTTVLSLVPLLAVSFSVLKGLGFYEEFRRETLEKWLEEFAPSGAGATNDYAHGLRSTFERVLDLVDRTDVRGLQAIGLLVVVWAVIRLLSTIESSFNDIWGVSRARGFVRKLTDYLAIVLVTPILLVIGLGLSTAASETAFARDLRSTWNLGPTLDLLVRFTPLLLSWVAFSFVYLAMPNARTGVRASLLGGLLAALAWQLALAVHLKFQVGVARYNAIYSTFAALPIFLIWVQLSWSIVLLGAEFAYAVQHEREFRRSVGWREPSPVQRAHLALRLTARIAAAFRADAPPRSAGDLARELGVPAAAAEEVLEVLAERGLVVARDNAGGARETAWLLARDPARVRLSDVLAAALEGAGAVAPELPATGSLDRVLERQLALLRAARQGLAADLSLAELVERAAREEADARAPLASAAQQAGGPA